MQEKKETEMNTTPVKAPKDIKNELGKVAGSDEAKHAKMMHYCCLFLETQMATAHVHNQYACNNMRPIRAERGGRRPWLCSCPSPRG